MKFFRKKRLLLDPERAHVTLPQSDADLVRLMGIVQSWGRINSYRSQLTCGPLHNCWHRHTIVVYCGHG